MAANKTFLLLKLKCWCSFGREHKSKNEMEGRRHYFVNTFAYRLFCK